MRLALGSGRGRADADDRRDATPREQRAGQGRIRDGSLEEAHGGATAPGELGDVEIFLERRRKAPERRPRRLGAVLREILAAVVGGVMEDRTFRLLRDQRLEGRRAQLTAQESGWHSERAALLADMQAQAQGVRARLRAFL